MAKPTIGVIGWYGHGNVGDESYRLSFPILFPNYDFVFSECAVEGASSYILGGGDIISDASLEVLNPFSNKHIMSATLSEYKKLDGFCTIALRDTPSLKLAEKIGVKAQYVPDFAFALSSNADNGRRIINHQFQQANSELYSRVVAVVINTHLSGDHLQSAFYQYNFQHASYELAAAFDMTMASFIFIPFCIHQPWDDRVAGGWIASKCKWWKKNTIVYDRLGVQDTIDVIAAADAVVSTRLHSSIFSCLTNTPFIDVTHNHKNAGFLETVELMDLSVPYSAINSFDVANRLNAILTDAARVRARLKAVTEKQRSILWEFAKNVHLV